jgi:hypothetical protein
MRQVDFAGRLGASQQQVHQRVVRQIEQTGQRIDLFVGQFFFVRIEEARENQIVLEQSPACAPTQAGTVGGIGLMRVCTRFHTRVRCWFDIILRLPRFGSTVLLLYCFGIFGAEAGVHTFVERVGGRAANPWGGRLAVHAFNLR